MHAINHRLIIELDGVVGRDALLIWASGIRRSVAGSVSLAPPAEDEGGGFDTDDLISSTIRIGYGRGGARRRRAVASR